MRTASDANVRIGTSLFQTLPDRLRELVANLRQMERLQENDALNIESEFITPLSITPMACVAARKSLSTRSDNTYLDTINFPKGLPMQDMQTWGSTYIPIIHIPLSGLPSNGRREAIEELQASYTRLLHQNIIADAEFIELLTRTTFGFLLSEMCANINEHSDAGNVFLFGQYWMKLNECEVCLLDDGVGILGSLVRAERDVANSLDALTKVIGEGLSAKDNEGSNQRGTGIRNTINVLTNRVVEGEFSILSGDACYTHSAMQGEQIFHMKDYSWKGTVVTMRLRKPVTHFSIYDHVR